MRPSVRGAEVPHRQPPGQNPPPITVAGSQAISAPEIKNGAAPFSVTTDASLTEIAGAPHCPKSQWTEAITDLVFTKASIVVEQPAPTVAFTLVRTFSPATALLAR